jgi:Calcineurin-like phosphoesterase
MLASTYAFPRLRGAALSLSALLAVSLAVIGCERPPLDRYAESPPDATVDAPDAQAPPDAPPGADTLDARAPDGGTSTDSGSDAAPRPETYSIVVLPDTQYYSSSWPDIFAAQTRWIVDNKAAQRIELVLHAGDIVDTDVPAQWAPASKALHLLDGEVPYVLSAGNHDYVNLADRMGQFNTYFPPSHFEQFPWFGGTYEPGHAENSFSVIGAGPRRWLVLALEFGPRDEVLAWASSVLALFRDTPAIIVTHAYLQHRSQRYDHTRSSPERDQFNPHDYVMMGQPGGDINDGEEMWRKLVEPNSNVKLVFSGHDVGNVDELPPGTTGRLTSTRADGTRVHQILANYQTCLSAPCQTNRRGEVVNGGNGYLRIVRISPFDHTLTVSTYSPYVDQSLTDDANQFTLPLD